MEKNEIDVKKKNVLLVLMPLFFGFFVMGFVDVVGIATSYVKVDFGLSERLSGFLPSMVFLWFFLFAIPSATIMNKIGRKNTVLLSMLITFIGMLIPFINYNIYTCFTAFALLGIGNTILQVSLNPLVSNVVTGKALTSSLTGGQVVKAISSFCGPFIALFAISKFGNWMYIFPIFAGITLLSALWLLLSPIVKENKSTSTSMGQSFALLKDNTILLLFLGIIAVVGIDVGINTEAPKLLMDRLGLDSSLGESVKRVSYAPSVYFACRTIGAFIATALLAKINAIKYFRIHIIGALLAITLLMFAQNEIFIGILIGLIGYTCSGIFSIIFSSAIQARPENTNEISGLMVTAICGGAIIPPVMTTTTSLMGSNQIGALLILALTTCYLIFLSFKLKTT